MTGWQPPKLISNPSGNTYRREVAPMTAFEIVSTILAIASLLIAFGMFVIALLAFLDNWRNKRK